MSRSTEEFYTVDRIPPQNLEVEEKILGGILVDPNALNRIKEIISTDDFYLSSHRTIYSVALELHQSGKAPDIMLVATRLADRGQLEKIGGQSKLADLYEVTAGAVNIDLYADLLRQKSVARKVIQIGEKITSQGFKADLSSEELLKKASEIYRTIESCRSLDGVGLIPLSETLTEGFSQIECLAATGILPGVNSGFVGLDALTRGFQKGDLVVIAGRPSMGKTAFGTHIALNMAETDKVVAFFSMEMSSEALAYRLLSVSSGIEVGRMKSGHIYEREWEPLARSCATLSQAPFFIDSQGGLSATTIESRIDSLEIRLGRKVDVVFIDYLQLMDGPTGFGGNKNQEIGEITKALKRLAMSRDIPVFLLSQLSRAVEARADKRPMSSDLRESGNIEQDADLVLMLYRDEYYDKSTVDRGIAEVIITKQRNGPTGSIRLLFESQYTRFLNIVT